MAYNRRNLLNKILEIQKIYLEHHSNGVTAVYIYDTYIREKYHISQRTFEKYLGVNAKMELKKLDDAANNNDKPTVQGSLDF